MPNLLEDPSVSDLDEFPDLDTLVHRARRSKTTTAAQRSTKAPSVRRRRLASVADNVLLKPWTREGASGLHVDIPPSTGETTNPTPRPKVQLRARKQISRADVAATHNGNQDGRETSIDSGFDEEVSADDSSEFRDTVSVASDDSDIWDNGPRLGYRRKVKHPSTDIPPPGRKAAAPRKTASRSKWKRRATAENPGKTPFPDKASSRISRSVTPETDLVGAIDRLRIDDLQPQTASRAIDSRGRRPSTPPPSSPAKPVAGLTSPKKLFKIPATPHHPSTDLFWSREFVDDWNDEHSPKHRLFPDTTKSPSKQIASPQKKGASSKTATDRDARKAFERAKHEIAMSFLEELDKAITQGRLSELAETTGGIKINWTNKLNTTAGRANWKRETVRTRDPDGTELSVKHRHHASIELAEKVIDDEHRLMNVIAHEFCHLANFMVTGISNNPHGKEFKSWAAKCSRAFGDRGIEVTTKHSYDIDFKYVWECTSCALEYKRHSRSINPDRHRCGSCKSQLRQTRPVPRAGTGKPSEYQMFMKEQMRLLKEADPTSPQKEIMKRVAGRWSSLQASSKTREGQVKQGTSTDEVAIAIEDLDLDGVEGGRALDR